MKIVITSSGEAMDSQVDPRFGRAKTLILFDTETGLHQVVDNTQNLNAAQGAGIQAAEHVSRLGAQCLITGHCGPKAFRTLQAAGIKVIIGAEGTVTEAIENFRAGQYTTAEAADVDGHWM
ncbi:MAG: NifB/NifX family molybdenum-iron cluster-binding protein [bacterium]